MTSESKKTARLTAVARMYYDRNMTQNEIAREINVSRPMVSKLLAEARDSGIVTIIIDDTADECMRLAKNIIKSFGLKAVTVVPEIEGAQAQTESRLALAALEIIKSFSGQGSRLGIGWGKTLGALCAFSDAAADDTAESVSPLSGGFNSNLPWEHGNGIAFALAEILGAKAKPVFLPAIFQSEEEEAAAKLMPAYAEAVEQWENINCAALEISPPETRDDCAGFILGHGFDSRGVFIKTGERRLQAEVQQLRKAESVLCIASCEISAASLLGALRTELFTHLVLTSTIAEKILSI